MSEFGIFIITLLLVIFVVCPILYFGFRLFLQLLGLLLYVIILFIVGILFGSIVLALFLIALPFLLIFQYCLDR